MKVKIKGDKTEIWCEDCGKIVIGDYDIWLARNVESKWIQCPYCSKIIRII